MSLTDSFKLGLFPRRRAAKVEDRNCMFAGHHGAEWRWLTGQTGRGWAGRRLLFAALAAGASLSVLAAAKPSESLTVRIEVSSGVPRLVVNGQPVRPRMFFGGISDHPRRYSQDLARSKLGWGIGRGLDTGRWVL